MAAAAPVEEPERPSSHWWPIQFEEAAEVGLERAAASAQPSSSWPVQTSWLVALPGGRLGQVRVVAVAAEQAALRPFSSCVRQRVA